MTSFTNLPVEVQRLCAEHLDTKALKAIRLVSRETATIGTAALFRTIVLRFDERSTANFLKVLAHEPFRRAVKAVIIDGQDGDKDFEHKDKVYNQRPETAWSLAIPKISQFPSLREVELWFCEDCGVSSDFRDYQGRQNQPYRTNYQEILFEVLEKIHRVDSITIKNLQDACMHSTGSRGISFAVLSRLKKLALRVVSQDFEYGPDYINETIDIHICFGYLARHWLKPARMHLTHLTLHCDVPWGVWPYFDVKGVHFPHLQSLALGKWVIAHGWQIDWIVSHGQTLEELMLEDCSIAYALQGSSGMMATNWPEWYRNTGTNERRSGLTKTCGIRWSDVFTTFRQHLKRLSHFGLACNAWPDMFDRRYELPAQANGAGYIACSDTRGAGTWRTEFEHEPNGIFKAPKCHAQDEQALEELLEALGYTDVQIETMAYSTFDQEKGWHLDA